MPEVITMGKRTDEFAEFPEHTKLLLICINRTYEKWGPCIAVRYSWKVDPIKAAHAELVLAVFRGKIVGVYEADGWLAATKENFSPGIPDEHGNWNKQAGRFGFHGCEAPEDVKTRYIGKSIPPKWKFRGNPIRHVNF
jgi:uncharacterized protein